MSVYSSETKYDSGSGWPSFYKTLDYEEEKGETVVRKPDDSIPGRPRVEVVCKKVFVFTRNKEISNLNFFLVPGAFGTRFSRRTPADWRAILHK